MDVNRIFFLNKNPKFTTLEWQFNSEHLYSLKSVKISKFRVFWYQKSETVFWFQARLFIWVTRAAISAGRTKLSFLSTDTFYNSSGSSEECFRAGWEMKSLQYALIKQLPHVNSTPEVDSRPFRFMCHEVIRKQNPSVLETAHQAIKQTQLLYIKLSFPLL